MACLAGGIPTAEAQQPNIIHIIADDLGWTDLGTGLTSKGNGSAFYQTPNIDALATGGMSFTSAYAVQTCVPTRVALFTGQYATRTDVYNVNGLNRAGNDTLLVGPSNQEVVPTTATTFAESLQGVGYTTAHVGKFHTTASSADITAEHGFDQEFGGTSFGAPLTYFATPAGEFDARTGATLDAYGAPYTQQYIDDNLKPFANGADVDSLVGTNKHMTDATADAAIDFMQQTVAADNGPFFVNLSFQAVHVPLESRPDLETKYDDILTANGGTSPDPRHDNAAYAGLVEGMDQAIGRVMAFVDDPNGDGMTDDSIADNTVVIFYSDNGGAPQATSNNPLRAGKGSQYEGGLRVPLIVWSPNTVAAGTVSDEPVHSVDFFPTVAELGGAALPGPSQPIDGESYAGIFTGQKSELDRATVFFHFPGYQGQTVPTSTAVLDAGDNRVKLMYFYEGRDFEVYDLNNDLSESTDLADGDMTPLEYKLASRAVRDLREWLDETDGDYPTVRADGSPVPAPSHTPRLSIDLTTEPAGLATFDVTKLGVTLSLTAIGDTATFSGSGAGIGIESADDSGGAGNQRRIDGGIEAPESPEAIEFSFDKDVVIKSLSLGAFNTETAETALLSFVSGDNPFAGLTGYDADGFTLGADSLAFDPEDLGQTSVTIDFGILGQDELLVTAGTVLSLTANPSTAGGLLWSNITIARPLSDVGDILLDANLDGVIDADDFETWRAGFGSSADLLADGNADNVVSAADYALLRSSLGGGGAAVGAAVVPEPTTACLAFVVVGLAIRRRSRN